MKGDDGKAKNDGDESASGEVQHVCPPSREFDLPQGTGGAALEAPIRARRKPAASKPRAKGKTESKMPETGRHSATSDSSTSMFSGLYSEDTDDENHEAKKEDDANSLDAADEVNNDDCITSGSPVKRARRRISGKQHSRV